jgi:hypothetical protein
MASDLGFEMGKMQLPVSVRKPHLLIPNLQRGANCSNMISVFDHIQREYFEAFSWFYLFIIRLYSTSSFCYTFMAEGGKFQL